MGLLMLKFQLTLEDKQPIFLAAIGGIDVKPDVLARVIINERTGTSEAFVELGIFLVAVSSSNIIIFLNPTTGRLANLTFFSRCDHRYAGRNADLVEEVGRFEALDELDPFGASTVNELASALNKLGLTTVKNDFRYYSRLKMQVLCRQNL